MFITDKLQRVGRSRIAAPLAIVMALTMVAVNELGYRSARHFDSGSGETLRARLAVIQLQRLLAATESAQRGYLITGRTEYKESYLRAREQLEPRLREIPAAIAPLKRHQSTALRLDQAARERISELDEVMRLFDAGERQHAITLVMTNIGRDKMLSVDEIVDRVDAEILGEFAEGRRRLEVALAWSRIGVSLLILAGLGGVLLWLRQFRQREAERQRQQMVLKEERDRLDTEVAHRTAELTQLARYLQTVREDERSRVARELHDELGGLLTAAKLDVARIRHKLGRTSADIAERLIHLLALLDSGLAMERRISDDLRPSVLRDLGLRTALLVLCADFAKASGIEVVTRLDDANLDEERALSAYRLVQEALTNVARHAAARHIDVTIRRVMDEMVITVHDDGRGLRPGAEWAGGRGLAGMRFRIRTAGGDMQLRSAPGGGTTIEARLPLTA